MIVNYVNEGWEIIHQQSHGMLSAQIASFLKEEFRPTRWTETLIAIANHDDRQLDWQGRYHLSEAGAPVDFTLKDFSLEQATAVTDSALYKSRWVGLMVSLHTSFLYEQLRGKQEAIDAFLDQQKKNQRKWKADLKISDKQVLDAYSLFQWCDRCSLTICRNELPQDGRKLEVFSNVFSENSFMYYNQDGTVNITPWPFDRKRFDISVEFRTVNQLKFKNDKELKASLEASETKEKIWAFSDRCR